MWRKLTQAEYIYFSSKEEAGKEATGIMIIIEQLLLSVLMLKGAIVFYYQEAVKGSLINIHLVGVFLIIIIWAIPVVTRR